jgi:hypothetical protein
LYAGDFAEAKYRGRSLETRSVLARRLISSGIVHIACDVSRLRNVLVRGFVRLRRDSNKAGTFFHGLEKELCATFAPTFMSRGESARELGRIRRFLDASLAEVFDRRSARQIRGQCDHVLKHGGAMALFGVFKSALGAVR